MNEKEPKDRSGSPLIPDEENAAARSGRKKRKRKKGSWLVTTLLFLLFFLGVGIIAYPTVSDWWNSFHQTRAIATYATIVESAANEEMEAMLQAAREYNETLASEEPAFVLDEDRKKIYESLLNLSGTGVIGYIQINSIGVNLPIYHGTEESVLQIAIGHLEWTSLPVGGEGTHTALSGHRGLPRAKLFTDLDKLREGDTFTITVLNQLTTYQVDQIRIVNPYELEDLAIEPGKDYCTLVTCTPYGINTHRLLVRGSRIENAMGEAVVLAGAIRIPNYVAIPALGIPMLFLFLFVVLIYDAVRRRSVSEAELERHIRERKEETPPKEGKGRRK
jgi:sortase A